MLALLAPCALQAQRTGTIRGTITSAESHQPLIGAHVSIAQPERAVVTDGSGRYVLRDVPAGSYAVTVSLLGFTHSTVDVTVSAGSTVTHDVALATGPLLLNGLVVTATRVPTAANKVASTVNVLTSQEIAASPARESQDMLREMPGVELPRTSSLVGGNAQIVSMRGVDEGRTVVLLDGIPITDAWGEWVDWGRAPKGMIDRVEVVEGGTSTAYGNGAIGGVISFFSRPMSPGSATLTIDGGSRGARHGFLSAGIPIAGAFSASISGDYLDGGGYTMLDPAKRGSIDIPSEIVQRNGYARLNYSPSARFSAFAAGHKFSDNRVLGTPFNRQSREQRSADLGLNYGMQATGMLSFRGWTGHQDEKQRTAGVRSNAASCATPGTTRACEDSSVIATIPSNDWGASAAWSRDGLFGLQSFTAGADYRHMDGKFIEADYNATCPGASCGNFVRTISSGGDQNFSGLYAQAIVAPVSPLRVELGARIDHWANINARSIDTSTGDVRYPDRSKTAFSPRVGARYELLSNLSVHGAYYTAFRAPNLAELYRKQINASGSQITLPNPDLKAESGRGLEGGVAFQPLSWLEVKGTYYVANYDDFNVPTTISAGPPAIRQRLNVNRARSTGGEAYVAVRPIEALQLTGSVNYDDARVVSDDSTTNRRHINRVPSPKQVLKAMYSSHQIGTINVMWKHEGQTTTLQGLPLKPFTVLDASAQREIVRGALAFVSVENITDEVYEVNVSGTGAAALYSFGMPRTVRVGLTLTR
jgi:iron complex outermembrane receptor protein